MNRDSEHVLYRYWNGDDLLYVGISVDAFARAAQHRRVARWWAQADRMTMERFPDRRSVLEAEKAAIWTEKPRYNIQGSSLRRKREPKSTVDLRPWGKRILDVCWMIDEGEITVFVGPIVNWGDPEDWWYRPPGKSAIQAWQEFGDLPLQRLYELVEAGDCTIWDAGTVLQIRARALDVVFNDDPVYG